jgi:hypothetical protein
MFRVVSLRSIKNKLYKRIRGGEQVAFLGSLAVGLKF